mgnify:CR=1 FL=1
MGVVDGDLTKIDTHELSDISQLRIEWNEFNRPVLHQIMPIGTPYVEEKGSVSLFDLAVAESGITIRWSKDGIVTLTSPEVINHVVVTDITGRNVLTISPNISQVSFMLHTPGFYIIKTSSSDGCTRSFKIAY